MLIGHRNERANRRQYPHHLPCSTSIVAFHQGELVLERLGSLGADMIAEVADRHGLTLTIGEGARERVPVRAAGAAATARALRPRRRLAPERVVTGSRLALRRAARAARACARRRRGPLTFISWARK